MHRLFLAFAMMMGAPMAQAASPPPVGADHAMVVSAHRLASAAGVSILRQGGNVVDAAVAVGYALAVVWPAAGNLGGGGFMSLRFADGRSSFIDFREKAPLAATETMFQDGAGHVVSHRSTVGWLAVGVPGSVAGLDYLLTHYGSMPRAAVMAPAIALARDGFVLDWPDVTVLDAGSEDFAKDPATAAIFLHDGQPYRVGEVFRQPQLAASLGAIARDGPDAMYKGGIGHAIAAASHAGGGIIEDADFAAYRVRELAPLRCTYRGYEIQTAPPPSGGGIAICEALNILEAYDLTSMGFHSAASVHVMAEAERRAFRDRQILGDPAFVANPTGQLTDKSYATRLRAGIDPEKATPSASLGPTPIDHEGQQTTHYSIADAAGNAVSVTTTLNGYFGTFQVAGDTGILMNNEMDDFDALPGASNMFGLVGGGHANAVAPGKTPLSSMSPTIVTRDGRLAMVIGSPGGSKIITTVLQAIVNMVDYGMDLGEAVSAPRLHEQWMPDRIDMEPRALSPDTVKMLEAAGYALKAASPWSQAEGIVTQNTGLGRQDDDVSVLARPPRPFALYGASDIRAPSGAAIGF